MLNSIMNHIKRVWNGQEVAWKVAFIWGISVSVLSIPPLFFPKLLTDISKFPLTWLLPVGLAIYSFIVYMGSRRRFKAKFSFSPMSVKLVAWFYTGILQLAGMIWIILLCIWYTDEQIILIIPYIIASILNPIINLIY